MTETQKLHIESDLIRSYRFLIIIVAVTGLLGLIMFFPTVLKLNGTLPSFMSVQTENVIKCIELMRIFGTIFCIAAIFFTVFILLDYNHRKSKN